MTPVCDEIVLDSRIEEIRKLGPWLARTLAREANDPAVAVLELVLVELVSNTIRHGHASEAGHAIRLRLERLGGRRIRVQIWDRGNPMPVEVLDRSSDSLGYSWDDIETLPESGFGLAMVRAAVDHLEYRSTLDGNNVTTIEKNLENK